MPTPEDVVINMLNNLHEHGKHALRIIYPSPEYDSIYNQKLEILDIDFKERIAGIRAESGENTGVQVVATPEAGATEVPDASIKELHGDLGEHAVERQGLDQRDSTLAKSPGGPLDPVNPPQVKIGGTKRHTRRFKKYKHIR